MLLSFFRNTETYNDFVDLVREYLPERERDILGQPSPHDQMAAFADYFEDRYLPLHPSFKEGQCEDDYYELLREIPVMVMGFGFEDYHELNNTRLGVQLMTYLFKPPWEDQEGERAAIADGLPPEYQPDAARVPAHGIGLNAAKRILKGKRWGGLRNWAEYINHDTSNWFLDTDDEDRWSGYTDLPWRKEDVVAMTKAWQEAQVFYDKAIDFAKWLEDKSEGPARFRQTVDFLLAKLMEEEYEEPNLVSQVAGSRGLLRTPRTGNT